MKLHRFWLIRHALVHPDAITYLYGANDVPVCDVTMEADAPRYTAIAAALPRAARLICTPLTRTQLTAQALFRAGYPAQTPLIEPAFVEQDFGDWQGLPISGFDARGRHQRHPFWPIHAGETPPGGESFDDMMGRVGPALDRLLERTAYRDTVIISHGGAIRAAIAHALKLSAHQALSLSIDNISLTRLEHNGYGWRLISMNEHLSTSPVPACETAPESTSAA